ncbi:MAG: hypothetical protein P4L69_19630, partial [Desulfosporosinus sp.]|nr:hypothetical protein [Desulfosporosinus sp.]
MKRKESGSRTAEMQEQEPQPMGNEGRHTPLKLLIYLRNPNNLTVLDRIYIAQYGNYTETMKKQRKLRRKAFQDYIMYNGAISNEPRNPKKPMHQFINMPQLACEYIRPMLELLLKGQNYAACFKKTYFDLVHGSKLHSVNMYIERILNTMGKMVGPPRNRKHPTPVEEVKIPVSSIASPREKAAATETPVAKRYNAPLAVVQASLTEILWPCPKDDVALMQNISRLYCALCKKMLNPEPWYISLLCIHMVCSKCASKEYRWNKYAHCRFCNNYVMASCRTTPNGSSGEVSVEKNMRSFVQINKTGYKGLEVSTKGEQFMNNLGSGKKLVFVGIKSEYFLPRVNVNATERKIIRARSVEMFDVDVELLFKDYVEEIRQVKKLVMINCECASKSVRELIKYNTQSIVSLNFCNCKFNDDAMAVLASYGDEFRRIRELVLKENLLTKISGPLIASFVRNKPHLRSLLLSSNHLGEGYLDIVKAVTGSPTMKFLGLGNNDITSLDPLFADMLSSTALEALAIYTNPHIDAKGIAQLVSGLARNHTIKLLWMRGIKMGDADVKNFAEAIATNDSLIELSMGYKGITKENISHIAAALGKNNKLMSLYLHYCKLTIKNLNEFAEVLRVNGSLRLLGIQKVRQKSDSADAIYKLIMSAKRLKHLVLGQGKYLSQYDREKLTAFSEAASEKGKCPLIQNI